MSDFKLYEYTQNYENLESLLEDNPDLDIVEALDNIKESATEKITNTAGFIKKLEDDVTLIKNRENELKAMRVSKQNKINSIKEYLLEHMMRMDIKKLDTGTRIVRYQNNRPSLNITNNEKVPDIFKKRTVTIDADESKLPKYWKKKVVKSEEKIDKDELMKFIKELDEQEYKDFAQIVQTKSLRIK